MKQAPLIGRFSIAMFDFRTLSSCALGTGWIIEPQKCTPTMRLRIRLFLIHSVILSLYLDQPTFPTSNWAYNML